MLWVSLIDEWRLSPYEATYINRQQGLACGNCHCNLRAMTLALAVMKCFRFSGVFRDFVADPQTRTLKILEINPAHHLTDFLSRLPGHQLAAFPDSDMMSLRFDDSSYDLVVHSDTLEHVVDPVKGLSECRRVLEPGGFCAFTVPIVVDRLTSSRAGLTPSYHGSEAESQADHLVETEYGCDAWTHVLRAGFDECRIVAVDYPSAHALVGVR